MSDKKDDNWEMPTPVFRTSTGSLPKTLEDTISHSFMPNAETIEIEESDDILSIMDGAAKDRDAKISEFTGGETIFNIGASIASAAEVPTNGDESKVEAVHEPQAVTANDRAEEAASDADNNKSNLVVYVVVALIIAAIIAAAIYYQAPAA